MTAGAMRSRHAVVCVFIGSLLSACSKPEHVVPTDLTASAAAAPSASDAPLEPGGFPNVPDGQKLIMSGFGNIIVPDTFEDSETGFATPAGHTFDTGYVTKGVDGTVTGRFAISHKEEAGTAVPDPVIAHLGDKAAAPTNCPGKTTDSAEREFVRGFIAHYKCAKGPFGGGIVATLRKDNRIYELMCTAVAEGGVDACVRILGQYRPN